MARILVVEDAMFIRAKIRDAVTDDGHIVVGEADNGMQAVAMYKRLKPDIVTLDITMPIMDGMEALKAIKKIDPEAKVIMLSAMGQQMIVVQCIKLGAKYFLVKPFTTCDLLRVIGTVLKNGADSKKTIKHEANGTYMLSEYENLYICNVSNTFIVEFPNPFITKSIDELKKFIDDVKLIKPLNIVIDYKDIEFISYIELKEIDNIVNYVREAGGKVTVYSQNTKFIGYIQSMKLNNFTGISSR